MTFKEKTLAFLGRHTKDGRGAFILSYFHNRGRLPNLRHPKDLSEIWIKYVLDGKVNEMASLADKYAVRDFVEKKGLGGILTPLLAVYNNADDIIFQDLPERFALKANFGATHNIICTDKSSLNIDEAREKVREWLKPVHYSESERHYNLIPPKFICEEFIDDGSGGFPVDYKFMCIKGKVFCILGVSGREDGHGAFLPYNRDWKPMPEYYRGHSTSKSLLPCPANLNEMIKTAEQLAEGIDLVRVDLYSNGSRIWFGEMTLTPSGCIFHRWTQRALDDMGDFFLRKINQ